MASPTGGRWIFSVDSTSGFSNPPFSASITALPRYSRRRSSRQVQHRGLHQPDGCRHIPSPEPGSIQASPIANGTLDRRFPDRHQPAPEQRRLPGCRLGNGHRRCRAGPRSPRHRQPDGGRRQVRHAGRRLGQSDPQRAARQRDGGRRHQQRLHLGRRQRFDRRRHRRQPADRRRPVRARPSSPASAAPR